MLKKMQQWQFKEIKPSFHIKVHWKQQCELLKQDRIINFQSQLDSDSKKQSFSWDHGRKHGKNLTSAEDKIWG